MQDRKVTNQLAAGGKWRTITSWIGFWCFVSRCDATMNQGEPSKRIHSSWAFAESYCRLYERCGQCHQQYQDQKAKEETKPSEWNTHQVMLGKVWIQSRRLSSFRAVSHSIGAHTEMLHLDDMQRSQWHRRSEWRLHTNFGKLTIRPGLAGTVPVWKCLSRNPERCLRDAKMSRFWPFWAKFGCNHVMSLCTAKN